MEYLTTVGGALVIGFGLYSFATHAKAKVTAQGTALSGLEDTVPGGDNGPATSGTLMAGLPSIPGVGGVNAGTMTNDQFGRHVQETLQRLSPSNPNQATISAPDPNNPGGVRVTVENENTRRQLARDTNGAIMGNQVIMRNDRVTGQKATQSMNSQGSPILPSDNATPEFQRGVREVSIQNFGNALGTLLGRPERGTITQPPRQTTSQGR